MLEFTSSIPILTIEEELGLQYMITPNLYTTLFLSAFTL